MMTEPWNDKVGNIHQIGGIETSVLDNGPARGSRIAWVNTGSGLRYKVAIDRCLDIVDAFYNRHSLTWLSHSGLTVPQMDANRGVEWLYTFAGGLLVTCGLTHVGGGESDEQEVRGIHGRISNIPAMLESVIQPDPASGNMEMSITAVMKESKVFGPHLELKRTITSKLGESVITISDEVTNRGNMPCPHMILYHCNFGWPLVDEAGEIVYRGVCRSKGGKNDNKIFNETHDYRKCLNPISAHKGAGGSCGFIDIQPDMDGFCCVGLVNNRLNLALSMKYQKKQLPVLTNWQHWSPGEYICALEPGTNPPIGQNKARHENQLILLQPGEKRSYQLEFTILSDAGLITKFLKSAK